jgi:hypothetical protein
MVGRELTVLVLQPEDALSTNFIRVRVPADLPTNEWLQVRVAAIDADGLVA